MREAWNEICFIVNRCRQANSSESSFQIEAENIFEKLGWSRYKGEVISQQIINVGSAHTVRPDIVVSNGQENLYVIELKKPSANFIERNTDQLISYMRLLKLNCGVLLGDSVRVFYDAPSDKSDPVEIINIPFEENNTDGAKLLGVIKHDGFTQQRLAEYCENRLRLIDARRNANRIVETICSNAGHNFIAEAVRKAILEENSEEIADLAIDAMIFSARKKSFSHANIAQGTSNPEAPPSISVGGARNNYKKHSWDPSEKIEKLETHPREGESFQDYVRRTLELAFSNQMLSQEEVELLKDASYSKRIFGLGYPLLVEGHENIYDRNGRGRYWSKPIYGNYYGCSQWWKAKIPAHEKLFSKWVHSLNEEARSKQG